MPHRKTDEDTDLGLPRKTVNKVLLLAVRSLIALVCMGAVWYSRHLNEQLDRMEARQAEMNLRVARIEWKLNIVADTTPKAVAAATPTP